jgi:hypothetical protein
VAIALGYAGIVLFGGYIERIEAFLRITSVYLQHTGHVAVYREGGIDRSLARPSEYSLDAGQQSRILSAAAADPRVACAAWGWPATGAGRCRSPRRASSRPCSPASCSIRTSSG